MTSIKLQARVIVALMLLLVACSKKNETGTAPSSATPAPLPWEKLFGTRTYYGYDSTLIYEEGGMHHSYEAISAQLSITKLSDSSISVTGYSIIDLDSPMILKTTDTVNKFFQFINPTYQGGFHELTYYYALDSVVSFNEYGGYTIFYFTTR